MQVFAPAHCFGYPGGRKGALSDGAAHGALDFGQLIIAVFGPETE